MTLSLGLSSACTTGIATAAQAPTTFPCIGGWHYDRGLFEHHRSATTVSHTLADIVSKNGNLLLSVPIRGDGTIDDDELAIVSGIADWMDVNREAIFGTRPWKVFGEGPALNPQICRMISRIP